MVRLYLFAEGQTEQTFADTLLKPHLANFDVFMDRVMLVAHARKKGKVHRGGGRKYLPMRNDILRFLKQESGNGVFFTTMIDLYALRQDFPGRDEAESLRHDPVKRVAFLESQWSQDIGDRRFIPFIQLHEYEAYLFTDISQLDFFGVSAKAIDKLKAVADSLASPELIDDEPHRAPSKRIIAEFPDYDDAKATIGPLAAELIGLQQIRSRCPHFDEWLSRLEGLVGRS
jgi:hypothetical protein